MIKSKDITLCLLTAILVIFAAGVVSAAVDYKSVVGNTPAVDPNSQVTITFTLKEDGNGDITNLAFDSPITLSGCSKSFEVAPAISGMPSGNTLAQGAESGTVTVTFNVPQFQDACDSYTGNLNLRGKYTNNVGPYPLLLSIKVNAKPSLEVSTPTSLSTSQNSTFTIKNTGNIVLTTVVAVDTLTYDSKTLTITPTGQGLLNPGATQTITLTANIPTNEESLLDGATTTVRVSAAGVTEITKTLSIESSYCELGNVGNLEIDRLKFTDISGFGDKNDWYLTDEIEVEVRVRNNNADDKIRDVNVAWGLYDKSTGNFVIDDEEKGFNLDQKGDSNDDKTITFTFVLDPADFDTEFSESDFAFFIKAYSDDLGEDVQCTSTVERDITIRKDNDFVVLDNIALLSDTVPCKGFLEGQFDIWNIGDSDEDDVSVRIVNTELGIDEKIEIGTLDVLDDKKSVKFSLTIPQNAQEKSYTLDLSVLDEYGDVFESDDNDLSEFTSKAFEVTGNCQATATTTGLVITAALDAQTPQAIAGKQVVIKANLKNTGTSSATYVVSVEGNSAWSSLGAIDPQTVTLNSGESKDISVILNINSDVSGDKEFTISANNNGQVSQQRVVLSVVAQSQQQLGPFAENLRENWFIYVIILVNLILIIAIILVVRRMLSPRVPM